jgi:hypothetical protein
MTEYTCPRRGDSLFARSSCPDTWRDDDTCSWCGSVNPDILMRRLAAGDVEVGPTDKSYKIYLRNVGGAPFKQTFRNCYAEGEKPTCTGPEDCTHWVTREIGETKFYFQHLSAEQQAAFIELYNSKRMKIGFPGHFYVRPFFCE